MRAALCKAYGPPSTLVIEEVDDPVPGPNDVLVRIAATGLNFFDTLIIENKYQIKPSLPFSPGSEMSGTVVAVGDKVTGLAPGDRVLGNAGYGCCAEMVALPARGVVKIGDDVSFEAAAGLMVTYGTTIHAFRQRADLQPGETVAILGASGGIGLAAIEIAKLMGARVIACASSDDKLEFCRERGADEVVNYSKEDLKDRLKELTGGNGVDVVYDPVGGDYAEAALRATAWKGRFLVIGFASGTIPKIPLNLALLKGLDIVGVFWGAFTAREPEAQADNVRVLLDWVASGALKPHIHAEYPLDKVADALEELSGRRAKGKVLIKP